MPAFSLIHMTAAYSNAVLVAVLPHVSDFAKQLELPINTPITINQVERFKPPDITNEFMMAAWLTNKYSFCFDYWNAETFRTSDDWFVQDDMEHVERFIGKDNMTTNQAIEFARSSIVKLGYKLDDFDLNDPPTFLELGGELKEFGHVPYCRVEWDSPKGETNVLKNYLIQFDVDMQHKQIAGMALIGRKFGHPAPKIDIVPELESDYRKRTQGHIFSRTNAPPPVSDRITSDGEGITVRPLVPP